MFKIGMSKVNITPPIGVELWGYGFYLNRKSKGVHDDLYCKVVVLDDSKNKIVLINNELGGISKEIAEKTRNLVQNEMDIPKDSIIITCTHTHSGPAVTFLRGWGEIDKDYVKMLPKYMAGAVITALNDMKDAKIGFGKGKVKNIAYNRENEEGPVDNEVGVVRIDDTQNNTLCILSNFSCHPVVLREDNFLISSDFTGHAMRMVEKETGGAGIFLQGACGDIDPIRPTQSFEIMEKYGSMLAEEVIKVSSQIKTTEKADMKITSRTIKVPLELYKKEELEKALKENQNKLKKKEGDENSLKWAYFNVDWAEDMLKKLENNPAKEREVEMQILFINDAVLVFTPGEVFTEFGLRIKKEFPFLYTFVACYANNYIGYIPTKEEFEKGSYAAKLVPKMCGNFSFTPDVGEVLVENILKLIKVR